MLFKGSKVYSIQNIYMQSYDVPMTVSMIRFIEKKDFENAYKMACLGVTEQDWR